MDPGRRTLVAAALYHACNDGTVAILPAMYVFPPFQQRFFSPPPGLYLEIAVLTVAALLTTVVFQVLFGYLSDRAHPGALLALGMLLLGAASLAIVGLGGFTLLLVAVVLLRIGSSFYHPVGIAWIAKLHRGGPVDRAMGLQSASGDAGVIVAFVSSPLLALALGWPGPFLLWGLASVAAAVVGLTLTRGVGHRPNPLAAPALTHLPRLVRSIAPWILPLAIGGASYTITISYGSLLLAHGGGLPPVLADGIIALWLLVGVVAAYLYGPISARAGRLNALRSAFLLITLAGLLLGLAPLPLVALPTFVAFGAGLFITYPALFAFVSEGSTAEGQGFTFGLVFAFQLLGGTLVAYPSGWLASSLGLGAPFLLMALLALVALVLLTVAVGPLPRAPRAPAGVRGEHWQGR